MNFRLFVVDIQLWLYLLDSGASKNCPALAVALCTVYVTDIQLWSCQWTHGPIRVLPDLPAAEVAFVAPPTRVTDAFGALLVAEAVSAWARAPRSGLRRSRDLAETSSTGRRELWRLRRRCCDLAKQQERQKDRASLREWSRPPLPPKLEEHLRNQGGGEKRAATG